MIIAICFQIGGTHSISVDAPQLPAEILVEKLPVAVGDYYSEGFQSTEANWKVWYDEIYEFKLGPQSMSLFDQNFTAMYAKVVRVQSRNPVSGKTQDIEPVLVPEFGYIGVHPIGRNNNYLVTMNCQFNHYNLDDNLICRWAEDGVVQSSNFLGRSFGVSESTKLAMRGIATNFL